MNHGGEQSAARPMILGIDARPLARQRTGVERMTYHFVASLSRLPHFQRIILFSDQAPRELPPLDERFELVVEPVRRPALQKVFDHWLTLQLCHLIQAHHVDVFFSPHTKFPWLRIPRFTTIHGLEWRFHPAGYRLCERLKQWFWFHACTRRSAGIITFAQHTREDIHKARPNCRPPICVAPEGVDPLFRRLEMEERSATVLDHLGVHQPYILSVCSLEKRKNLDGLLRAYAQAVRQHGLQEELVLVGQPKWRSERLRRLVADLAIGNRVRLTGYVTDPQLLQLYNLAALFVYPSKYEGFGLPVLEAMACGTPVVTANVSALPQVAGDAAILINPDQDEDLTTGIVRGLTDQALRAELIQKGLARVERFGWLNMTRTICDFITTTSRSQGHELTAAQGG